MDASMGSGEEPPTESPDLSVRIARVRIFLGSGKLGPAAEVAASGGTNSAAGSEGATAGAGMDPSGKTDTDPGALGGAFELAEIGIVEITCAGFS
jgi:hypothetical protein